MLRLLVPAFLAAISGLVCFACSPSQPPETPESLAGSAAPSAEPAPSATAAPGALVKGSEAEQKGQSLESYELTPSDCDALGRQYGAVARADQMAALSPKLSEKQRTATAAQIDKVVGKLEESWIAGCHANLVNKAVDHGVIKCALASKTVKQFDICLNGEGGTPQPAGKPDKKK
ncbi:Hypothetical protein A7982_00291 [Minicystis rosea]|nr:Hypothetical protein A7982_00291 [Minicystis rosea]